MHRKKTKDLPEAAGDASDGSRAAGFESKGVVHLSGLRWKAWIRVGAVSRQCRRLPVSYLVRIQVYKYVSCEAARGMSTAPSMNRTAAWFGNVLTFY